MNANPVSYFEIPVTDMDRAAAFYADVLQTDLERAVVDGYDMALFPPNAMGPGASGALAKGDVYVPSLHGPIIYFTVSDIDAALSRARIRGAELLFAKKKKLAKAPLSRRCATARATAWR
ncbi:MAG: VOC family protein [Sphingopyxis sp.]|nr:VOC family protein [Sphingopyxis sp.]